MDKRLYKILDTQEILYYLQFGFRKKHSATNALLSLTETIKLSIDNGKFGSGIFLDLQKAFDTVNHSILLQKLKHYGIRDNALQWFKSYLNERSQYVTVNGYASDMLLISCGVPQSPVLVPYYFLFMSMIPNASKILRFYLFTNDTSIYLIQTICEPFKKLSQGIKKSHKMAGNKQISIKYQ